MVLLDLVWSNSEIISHTAHIYIRPYYYKPAEPHTNPAETQLLLPIALLVSVPTEILPH